MDERIEKAFLVANHMATLSNQRRIILEEFNQKLVYYINGGTFKITPELISFTKITLDFGHTTDVAFVDANNFPIVIADVQEFFDNIVGTYFEVLNEYSAKFTEIKSKRKVGDIIGL
jgi:hypothetical protein